MDCPNSHGPLVVVGQFMICGQCGFQNHLGTQSPLVPNAIPGSIAQLPSVLAIPLAEYSVEFHPLLKLHRLCDTAEIVTRFFAIVALGELRARLGSNPLPADLLKRLQPHIERPTFGVWRDMLRAICDCLNSESPLVVDALPKFVSETLLPGLSRVPRTPETNLIELRNRAVHGGALTTADAHMYLAIWSPWLKNLTEQLVFLNKVEVCHYAEGRASLLLGPQAVANNLELDTELIKDFAGSAVNGHVLLIQGGRWLDLWPLCDYGRATSTSLACKRHSNANAPLVFFRAERDRLLYAALGIELSQSEQPDTVTEFRDLFQLERRQPAPGPDAVADYEEELRADAQLFVGRATQIRQAKDAIKSTNQGVLWISGPPGIGKSFLMARLAEDLRGDQRKGRVRIAWRFKTSDIHQCTRVAFFRHAITRLADWLGQKDVAPSSNPEHLYQQFAELLRKASDSGTSQKRPGWRVLIVLDGIDEIARSDADFLNEPFRLSMPFVVWLCAGRPDTLLTQKFAPDRCRHIFPAEQEQDGLPPMSRDDIRGMLLDGTGAFKYNLLARDQDATDDMPVINDAVEAIVERAQGLPLFVRLAVHDLNNGQFDVADLASRLPHSLAEYYNELLRRMSIGELQALLTPLVVTICHGHAPLDIETLLLLMVRRRVLRSCDSYNREILLRGLASARAIIRAVGIPGKQLLGYEPYHETFRAYVLSDECRLIGLQNEFAKEELCSMACDWHRLEPTSYARDYAFRHGTAHLLASQRWNDLYALLTDIFFLEATNAAGLMFNIASVLRTCAAVWPRETPERKQEQQVLNIIHNILSSNIHFINDNRLAYPQGLFQCLWNSCAWPDCNDRTRENENTRNKTYSIQDAKAILSSLVESWRTAKETATPGFAWLRSLRPPGTPLPSSRTGVLKGHQDAVTGVIYSEDGKNIISTSNDGTIRLWDASSQEQISADLVSQHMRKLQCRNLFTHNHTPCDIGNHHDQYIATFQGGEVAIWSLNENQLKKRWNNSLPDIPLCHDVDASGRYWIGETDFGSGRSGMWTRISACVREGKNLEKREPFGLLFGTEAIAISPSGRWAASVGRYKQVRVWDLEHRRNNFSLRGHGGWAMSLAFSSDESLLASGGSYADLRLWDLESQTKIGKLNGHTARITALAFSRENSMLASGSKDTTVRVWNVSTQKEICCLTGHSDTITSLAFSPDGSFLASASLDTTIQIWDLSSSSCRPMVLNPGNDSKIMSLSISPRGGKVATGHMNGEICIWDSSTGRVVSKVSSQPGVVRALSFSPDENFLVSGLRPFRLLATHENDERYYKGENFLFFHEDYEHGIISSRFCYSGEKGEGFLRVWDINKGSFLDKWDGHPYGVREVVWSGDGTSIFSLGFDREVYKWHFGCKSPEIVDKGDFQRAKQELKNSPDQSPLRLVPRTNDTIVTEVDCEKPIAYWPESLKFSEFLPNSRIFTGVVNQRFFLLVLEGTSQER